MAGFANSDKDLDDIEASIKNHVELEKLVLPIKLLGMELTWEDISVKLTQAIAIGNLTNEHGIQLTIPTKSLPLNPNDYALSYRKRQKRGTNHW